MKLRAFLVVGPLAFLAGCAPSRQALRQKLSGSPYASITLFPLDRAPATHPYAGETTAILVSKLEAKGFTVIEQMPHRGKAPLPDPAAAKTAERQGSGAALTGIVEEAFEREDQIPPVYEFVPVPPPRCCSDALNPCRGEQVFDDQKQIFVLACHGSHKRVQKERGKVERRAGLALRLRLIDAASGKVVWEDAAREELKRKGLRQAAERAVASLTDRLIDAVAKPPEP